MSKYRVGDVVRVLHTDYASEIPVGACREVVSASEDGVDLKWPQGFGNDDSLFFFDWEVESVGVVSEENLDAIIAKLERIKALREELGLIAA